MGECTEALREDFFKFEIETEEQQDFLLYILVKIHKVYSTKNIELGTCYYFFQLGIIIFSQVLTSINEILTIIKL